MTSKQKKQKARGNKIKKAKNIKRNNTKFTSKNKTLRMLKIIKRQQKNKAIQDAIVQAKGVLNETKSV